MTEFDEGVAVTRRPDDEAVFDALLGEGWQIGAGVNGGLLLAVMGSALQARFVEDGHADPVAVSAYYLSASRPGPAVLRTEVLRRGRRDLAPPDFMEQASFLNRLDLRLDPSCVGWAVGDPSGRGLLQGWLRMADGREPDPLLMLLAVDALPPVTFDLGMLGWTPTLELSVHVRADPAPGWLAVTHRTRNYAGGLLEEDAEVWDSTGRLVAQSRQLARAPR
jgi:hypothetical protein